eukprot:TRINITY_DN3136_c0_g3_i1.p4 TRINITY_DN3136_c0_g3~~TRINITY_DN3136_c0_g3_i1.p4  ORF type:complete len:51 (-),score=10.31 TRINITY_DN3136_c0_g3_i1:146-298(-)
MGQSCSSERPGENSLKEAASGSLEEEELPPIDVKAIVDSLDIPKKKRDAI